MRKGSRSRRSTFIWVTSKVAELIMRADRSDSYDPCAVEADTCPLLTCADMRNNGWHDADHRGERGWQTAGGAAGPYDEADE
ncbi:hypothetical protein GCM10010412_035500 [Nonomuraea recticatena]|uniref:Uncharacterized protein n=1 Tax=Nonomuraea recticatena TaxID=46178 RepID=A0ABN3RZY3_9ACTN